MKNQPKGAMEVSYYKLRSLKVWICLMVCLLVLQTVPVRSGLTGAGTAAAEAGPVQFSPTNDAHVQGGTSANTIYGTAATMPVKYVSTDPNVTRQAFMTFDYGAYTGNVGTATLSVYGTSTSSATVHLSVYGVEDDTWTEGTVTWNKKPVLDHYLGSVDVQKAGNWINLDVTSYVRSQMSQDKKASFAFVLETSDVNTVVSLNSKENTVNRPYLELSGQPADPAAPQWPAGAAVSFDQLPGAGPTLHWSGAQDLSGVTGYRIYRNGTLIGSTAGNQSQFSLPVMEAGKKYTYNIEAGNAANKWSHDGPYLTWTAGDASHTFIPPTADTYVQGGTSATVNNGRAPSMVIKNIDADPNVTRQSLMKFNLDGYTGELGSAKLKVYAATKDGTSVPIFLYGLENDVWEEYQVTWNTKPALDHMLGSVTTTTTYKWFEVDVTSFVKKQLAGDRMAGFAIVEQLPSGFVVSVNAKENSANRPYLELSSQRVNETAPSWPADASLRLSSDPSLGLNWTPAADASGVTAYKIYQNGVEVGTVQGNVTSFPLTLDAGKKFTYKVEAENAANQRSNDGPYVTFIVPDPPRVGAYFPVEDAYVQGGSANTKNFGSDESLLVKNMDADPNVTRQAFLKFDLSGFTDDVGSAKLYVYAVAADSPAVDIQFFGLEDDTWKESTVTWTTKPASEHYLGSAGLNPTWKWVEIDVTSYVKQQFAKDQTAGFGIVQLNPAGNVAQIVSRESAVNRPYLQLSSIRSTPLAPAWPVDSGVQVTGMTESGLQLSWRAASNDTVSYSVYNNGTFIARTDSGVRTLQVTGLEPGKKYTFKVDAAGPSGQRSTDGPFVTVTIPKTELVQMAMGNVFAADEPIQFKIATTRPSADWKVLDWQGAVMADGTAVSSNGEALIGVPFSKLGYFTLQARVVSDLYDPIDLTTSFTVVPIPPQMADLEGSPFGVAAHLHRTAYGWTPNLTKLMQYAGIKMARGGIEWSGVEKTKGAYTFTVPDQYMGKLKDENFDFLYVSGYNNPLYDNNSTPYTNEGRQGFADYVKAYVDQYADQLEGFEVYNEFNGGFGDRGTGPADSKPDYYFSLLKTVYETVKPAHPDLPVIGMDTAGIPLAWMEEVFKLGGLNYMDAVSFHPYRYPNTPEGLADAIHGLDELIRKYNNGQPKPLWISEVGWPTFVGVKGVTEKTQADYLLRSYVVALSKRVEKIIWYDLMNDGIVKDLNEDNFGILRNASDEMGAYTGKPAYGVYAAMTKELTHADFVREEAWGGSIKSYLFDQAGQPLRVIWSTSAAEQTVIQTDLPVQIVDSMGNTNTLVPFNGKVYLTLTGEAVYLKGDIAGIATDPTFSLKGQSAYTGEQIAFTVGMNNRGSQVMNLGAEVEGRPYTLRAEGGTTASQEVQVDGLMQPGQRFADVWLYSGNDKVGLLRYSADVLQAYELTLHPTFVDSAGAQQILKLKIRNLSDSKPLHVAKADWKLGTQSGTEQWNADLAPGEIRTFAIPITNTPSGSATKIKLKVDLGQAGNYSYEGSVEFNPIFMGTVQVDGTPDPAITATAPVIDLAKGTNKITGYQGASDLSGNIWLHYDRDNLYLTAKITDNTWATPFASSNIWQNDSIQFGIVSGLAGQSTDWYEYGLSQTADGPLIYRWTAPKGKPTGAVNNGNLQITRDEATHVTAYELALPWSELTPVKAAKDGVISFSLLVNDNDGSGRRGWIEWGSGIGEGKQLSKFRPMEWVKDSYDPVVVIQGVAEGKTYSDQVVPVVNIEDEDQDPAGLTIELDGGGWTNLQPVKEKGPHQLVVQSVDQQGNTASGSVSFTITHGTSLQTEPASVRPGETAMLKAVLTDKSGNPVAGETVMFQLNGTEAGSAVTNAQGMAVYGAATDTLAVGSYVWKAEYAGNETAYYTGSESDGELAVQEGETNPPITLTEVRFDMTPYSLYAGDRLQAVVEAVYSDGSHRDITAQSGFSSDNTGIVQVDPAGLLTGIAPGSAVVRAGYGGMFVEAEVRVSLRPTGGNDSYGSPSSPDQRAQGWLHLAAGASGEVSLGGEANVSVPAGALHKPVTITIGKVKDDKLLLQEQLPLLSNIYEFLKDVEGVFEQPVTIRLAYDPLKVKAGQQPAVYYYDEQKKEWVEVGEVPTVEGQYISVQVHHFTKFAVFAMEIEQPKPQEKPGSAIPFTDIGGHWAKQWIEQAVTRGIINGYDDGGFLPDHPVTRQEFITMLVRTASLQEEAPQAAFTDAAGIAPWARSAVSLAVRKGWIEGYEDASFRPQRYITRSEMAVILMRAVGGPVPDVKTTGFGDDADITQWAKPYIAGASANGLLEGRSGGRFEPAVQATRAEAAVMLLRMADKQLH